jgi:hypothetical protein
MSTDIPRGKTERSLRAKRASRATIGGVAALMAVVAGPSVTAHAKSEPGNSEPDPSTDKSPNGNAFGVTVDGKGVFHYDGASIGKKLGLGNHTKTVVGTKNAAGGCDFYESGVVKPGEGAYYAEELSFDPASCTRVELFENLPPGLAKKVKDLKKTPWPDKPGVEGALPATPYPWNEQPSTALSESPVPALAGANFQSYGEQQAMSQSTWVDPVFITITGLIHDMGWPTQNLNGMQAHYKGYPYHFVHETFWGQNLRGGLGTEGNHFRSYTDFDINNTEFQKVIWVTMGLSGFIACGATTGPAHFHHEDGLNGYKDGNGWYQWWNSDSKDGACTNLVHHDQFNQYGWRSST